ncbi:hypothetical protein FGO68_gene5262 [Halteria grandinella]|uniref:Uncharacterized protein n=1 Tax=Halteria grandinella TaxID=5974 RepID=A0A8J8NS34_HALGN|nr:hypothetical protein FGO68_gene5262 [Halteria grandinella]
MWYKSLLITFLIIAYAIQGQGRSDHTEGDYLNKFFRDQFAEKSPHLDISYDEQKGFHTIQRSEYISRAEALINIPDHYAISAWDDFDLKREILTTLLDDQELYKNTDIIALQYIVFGLRLMLASREIKKSYGLLPQGVLGFTKQEDKHFWVNVLKYWEQARVDDLEVWSEDQLAYLYEFAHYQPDQVKSIKSLLQRVVRTLQRNKRLSRAIGNTTTDLDELIHWVSVVKSRNHGLDFQLWIDIQGIEESFGSFKVFKERYQPFQDENLELNRRFWKNQKVNFLLPLIDMINHHQPSRANSAGQAQDLIQFRIDRVMNDGVNFLTIRLDKAFTEEGQEVAYTYNQFMLEPFVLLKHYGFTVPNNLFSVIGFTIPNGLISIANQKKSACEEIGCSDIVDLRGDHSFNLKKHSINRNLLNLLTVEFLKGSEKDIIRAMSEYSAQVNGVLECIKFYKSSLKSYQKASFDIERIQGYNEQLERMKGNDRKTEADLRRKIMVHEVTLSTKQVVQLNEIYALKRGIHLIWEQLFGYLSSP